MPRIPRPAPSIRCIWLNVTLLGILRSASPIDKTKVAIVFSGALLPEARAAAAALAAEDIDDNAALRQVLSPDRLHAGWAGGDGRPAAASRRSSTL